MTEDVLIPYLLSAIAVGGVANTLRFWGRTRLFLQHWIAIVIGVVLGLTLDWSGDGLRAGLAVGGVSLPVYDLIVSRIRARKQGVRNESSEESG